MKEQDSFEQYKGELEEELGICQLKPPKKPMNAYMRFFLERSSEERAKGESNFGLLSSTVAAEWNTLPANKRDFYQQIYEIRSKERDRLLVQYELLSNKRKVLSPYSRFIKKRYLQYSKEYKNLSSLEINKLANEDWLQLSIREKDRLREQFEDEKRDLELGIDRTDQVEEYLENLERYHEVLEEEKNKILWKYGLSAEHKAQVRLNSRERRMETTRMIKDIKEELKKEERKKYRESVKQQTRKAVKAEVERIFKISEDQREQEKYALRAERARIRGEALEVIKQEREEGKEKQRQKQRKPVKTEIQAEDLKNNESGKKATRSTTKTKKINKNETRNQAKSGKNIVRKTRRRR